MFPAAVLVGELVEREGCLFWVVTNPDGSEFESLPIWNGDEFSLQDGDSPSITYSGGQLEVGQRAKLGGGERTLANAEEMIGGEIPERCQTSGYWLASGVASEQG